MQAIGRCMRFGQARTVFLWRFCTLGTVEEEISAEHRADLWRRRARRPPRAPHVQRNAEAELVRADLLGWVAAPGELARARQRSQEVLARMFEPTLG